MDILNELRKPRTKVHAKTMAGFISQSEENFKQLIAAYLGDDMRVTQNAAYFLMHVSDLRPDLFKPYLNELIENLRTNPVVAIKRNTLRILQHHTIPETYHGEMVETCFQILLSSKEPIAVKAFAMTVLSNLTDIYPDLRNELRIVIEDLMKEGSAGVVSRGKKILKHLDSLDQRHS